MRRAQLACSFRYPSLKDISDDVAGTILVQCSKTWVSFADSAFGAASTAGMLGCHSRRGKMLLTRLSEADHLFVKLRLLRIKRMSRDEAFESK